MSHVLTGTPKEDFPVPERVVLVPVDLDPSNECVRVVTMAFVKGTEPAVGCGTRRQQVPNPNTTPELTPPAPPPTPPAGPSALVPDSPAAAPHVGAPPVLAPPIAVTTPPVVTAPPATAPPIPPFVGAPPAAGSPPASRPFREPAGTLPSMQTP